MDGSHRCNDDKKSIGVDFNNIGCCLNHCWIDGNFVSDYMEVINPQTMLGRLYYQGEIVEIYEIEQCDKCSKLVKHDKFGYQIGYDRTEKVIWFCGACR